MSLEQSQILEDCAQILILEDCAQILQLFRLVLTMLKRCDNYNSFTECSINTKIIINFSKRLTYLKFDMIEYF